MSSHLKRVAGNTGLGLVSGLITLGAGILRAILLAKYFDLLTFGYFVICTSLVTFVRVLLKLGVGEVIIRFVPEFELEGRKEALSSLLVLVAYVAGFITALIYVLGWAFSPTIAEAWYQNPELKDPILYSALLSGGFLFSHSAIAFLRVQNQFLLAIIPPAIGACLGPFLIFLLHQNEALTLTNAVLAVGIGDAVGIVGCTGLAAIKSWRILHISKSVLLLKPLREFRPKIRSTLTQTSLFGILDSSTQIGGIFLLGLLGTPAQVAILGMSMQLSRPLNLLQASLGSAISPEVTRMYTENKIEALYQFVVRYVKLALAIVAAGLVVVWLLAPVGISLFLKDEYLEAVPVFVVFILVSGLVMAFQPFLPIAIVRGEVGRRNLVVCIRFIYLGIACLAGLTAMGVALTVLAGNLSVRVLNDLPLMNRLRKARMKAIPLDDPSRA